MWEQGLVQEVAELAAAPVARGRTASRALGYAQVLRHLDGDCSLDEAREDTVRATRRFARRQESWFRRDPRVRWVPSGGDRARVAAIIAEVRDSRESWVGARPR
jgi:tRNA dimethylallyltransferase